MSSYRFLSPEWIDAARQVRDEYTERLPAAPMSMRANVVVSDAPFSDGPVRAYIDTSAGTLILEEGELDAPELTIKIDYTTARRIFVDRDQNAAMEGFFSGRIVVEGDITRVLALQGQTVDPLAEEIATRIAGFTAAD